MLNLQKINLSFNQISEISKKAFKKNINLRKIDLSNNKLSDTSQLSFLHNLVDLKDIKIDVNPFCAKLKPKQIQSYIGSMNKRRGDLFVKINEK